MQLPDYIVALLRLAAFRKILSIVKYMHWAKSFWCALSVKIKKHINTEQSHSIPLHQDNANAKNDHHRGLWTATHLQKGRIHQPNQIPTREQGADNDRLYSNERIILTIKLPLRWRQLTQPSAYQHKYEEQKKMNTVVGVSDHVSSLLQ